MAKELSEIIIEAAQEVFNVLGNGHSEQVLETALELELWERSLFTANIRRQVPCPLYYKGYLVGFGNVDILINNSFVLELKSVTKLTNKDESQLRKYLVGLSLPTGLLINFNPGLEEIEVIECQMETLL